MKKNIFSENYKKLNKKQKEACDTIYGPVMVVAGPGTGKTQIIAIRTANILKKTDIKPENIFITTFTEAGVVAIKDRLLKFIGKDAYKVNVSTIHSFATDVIKTFPEKFLEYRAMTPIDEVEQLEIIKSIIIKLSEEKKLESLINDYDKFLYLRDIKSKISSLKQEGVSIDRFKENIFDQENIYKQELSEIKPALKKYETTKKKQETHIDKLNELVIIWQEYNKYLRENSYYDFNDMINFVLEKFENDEELSYHYAEKFQFIMLDEFQDTNDAQNKIINLILKVSDNTPNIMVVGDDDQSIYRFQGANIENMLDFSTNYSDTEFIVLENNYRSTQNILDLSKSLIENNFSRLSNKISSINKVLTSSGDYKNEDIKANIFVAQNDIIEKTYVLEKIKELCNLECISEFGEEKDFDSKKDSTRTLEMTQKQEVQGRKVFTKGTYLSVSDGVTNFSDDEIHSFSGISLEDIAIIVRNNREVEERTRFLNQNNLAVESKQKTDILKSDYINLLLKYLKVINNPLENENDFLDLVRSNLLSLDQVDIFKINRFLYIKNYRLKNKISFFSFLLDLEKYLEDENNSILEDIDQNNLLQFREDLLGLSSKYRELNFKEFLNYFLVSSGFLDYLQKNGNFDDLEDVYTLFNIINERISKNKDFNIDSLISKIELYKSYNYPINRQIVLEKSNGIHVLTAHSSKGLEYEVVFIPGLYYGNWDNKIVRDKLKLPDNIAGNGIQEKQNDIEEERRLFFVAMTRSKKYLHLSYSASIGTKICLASSFVNEIEDLLEKDEYELNTKNLENTLKNELSPKTIDFSINEFDYIKDFLKNYKLSPSDLNTFLRDPKEFLNRVILKYPFIDNKFTIFGNVYHRTLELFYLKFKKEGILPDKSYLSSTFSLLLEKEFLTPNEFENLKEKGISGLSGYYDKYNLTMKAPLDVECNFSQKNIFFDSIPLTGKIDKIDISDDLVFSNNTSNLGQQALFKQSVCLVDYKTGRTKSVGEIKGIDRYGNKKDEGGEYFRQLMFYKLLCENDKDFYTKFDVSGLAIDFAEGKDGKYNFIKLDCDQEEFEDFKNLVKDSWQKINDIEFWKNIL